MDPGPCCFFLILMFISNISLIQPSKELKTLFEYDRLKGMRGDGLFNEKDKVLAWENEHQQREGITCVALKLM